MTECADKIKHLAKHKKRPIREDRQKTFLTLSGFWPLSGWGSFNTSVKKGIFVKKIFFSDNVEWSSKNLWKMTSADVKANKNNNK